MTKSVALAMLPPMLCFGLDQYVRKLSTTGTKNNNHVAKTGWITPQDVNQLHLRPTNSISPAAKKTVIFRNCQATSKTDLGI